jgi:hypothetical protein
MLRRVIAVLSLSVLGVACVAPTDDEPDQGSTDEALSASPKNVSLMYEGTCAFLHNCSTWSRKLPVGEVQWGCGGTTCDDDANWVAGPSRAYCNKTVKICKGARCTTAVVKDISVAKGWEASNGVMDDLGLGHTVDVEACSGSGGGRVTVQLK